MKPNERGQASLLWIAVIVLFVYALVYVLSTSASDAALDHASSSIMTAKCDSVIETLQEVEVGEKSLMTHVLENLFLENSPLPKAAKDRILTVLRSVKPGGYEVGFAASREGRMLEIETRSGKVKYRRSYELSFREVGEEPAKPANVAVKILEKT